MSNRLVKGALVGCFKLNSVLIKLQRLSKTPVVELVLKLNIDVFPKYLVTDQCVTDLWTNTVIATRFLGLPGLYSWIRIGRVVYD